MASNSTPKVTHREATSKGPAASQPGQASTNIAPNPHANGANGLSPLAQYKRRREIAVTRERQMGFEDRLSSQRPSGEALRANEILQRIKELDMSVYQNAGTRKDSLGQEHPRFYGDHFLSNVRLIEKTRLFKLLQAMPKGGHLHIHFNANCHPGFLLSIAKRMDYMYIWSSRALTDKDAFDQCKIQFSILSDASLSKKNPAGPADIFRKGYSSYPGQDKGSGWMHYKAFRAQFAKVAASLKGVEPDVDRWLQNKIVFHEEEAHNSLQTAAGAWEKFNARTQMMKGLFNYKTAYVEYIREFLAECARDNIQYAEIRPNFMQTNQVWEDDGSKQLTNEDILKLIIAGYEASLREPRKTLMGLKIIYCTPRSFDKPLVAAALKECLAFKKKYPAYIAGFDLVGEEGNGRRYPLQHFAEEFLQFQADCKAARVEIPFLFHCGETLENGTTTDGNLFDAVLLGAKRIGHGYAVPWHPWVMEQMKAKQICVELCPISNEILGLTPRIGGHSAYVLLANNIPCSISTDNGTLFRSTLSHDFYQIMAGKADMTLWGLQQLCEWSLQHACLDGPGERDSLLRNWKAMWDHWVKRICAGEFGGVESSSHSQSRSAPRAAAAPPQGRSGNSNAAPSSGTAKSANSSTAGKSAGSTTGGKVASSQPAQSSASRTAATPSGKSGMTSGTAASRGQAGTGSGIAGQRH